MTEQGRLERLEARLQSVDEVPIEQRVALFDEVNRALVAELDALED